MNALGHTIYNDPVGFLADLSAILGSAGFAGKAVGEVSGISGLTKAGEIAGQAGTYVDPLAAISRIPKLAANKATEAITSPMLTPAESSAVSFAGSNQIPLPLDVATQNPALAGIRGIVSKAPIPEHGGRQLRDRARRRRQPGAGAVQFRGGPRRPGAA